MSDMAVGAPVPPKIALAIPSRDTIAMETAHALIALVGRFTRAFVATGEASLSTVTVLGTLLPQMRNEIVARALDLQATHILWVDSDMTFPADALERLLSLDLPVVGANYAQRKRPSKPTAAKRAEGERIWVYGGAGVEPVEFLGHGLCLVETAVYEALPKPWYMLGWSDERQTVVGEDVWFCRRLPLIGVVPHVDHALSERVGHVGGHEYTMADAVADRPAHIALQDGR